MGELPAAATLLARVRRHLNGDRRLADAGAAVVLADAIAADLDTRYRQNFLELVFTQSIKRREHLRWAQLQYHTENKLTITSALRHSGNGPVQLHGHRTHFR